MDIFVKNIYKQNMEYIYHYKSTFGNITIASNGESITGLWFDGQKHFAETLDKEHKEKDLPVFRDASKWLDIYFSGKEPDFSPQILVKTTEFRKSVIEILQKIPYGQTMTYGEISKIIAKQREINSMSAQAIGNAVGHNPISIIIPCHRVIGSNGNLTGYAGGLEIKKKLLLLEKYTNIKDNK